MINIQIEYINYVINNITNSDYYKNNIISHKLYILQFKSSNMYYTDRNLRNLLNEIIKIKFNKLDITLEYIKTIRKLGIISYDSYIIYKRKKLINKIFE